MKLPKTIRLQVEMPVAAITALFKEAGVPCKKAVLAKVLADHDFRRDLAYDLVFAWNELNADEAEVDPGDVLVALVPDRYHAQLGIDKLG